MIKSKIWKINFWKDEKQDILANQKCEKKFLEGWKTGHFPKDTLRGSFSKFQSKFLQHKVNILWGF